MRTGIHIQQLVKDANLAVFGTCKTLDTYNIFYCTGLCVGYAALSHCIVLVGGTLTCSSMVMTLIHLHDCIG